MHPLKEVLICKEILINRGLCPTQSQTLQLLLELNVYNDPGRSKELLLQLTDESDPLFLLSTIITESGYQNLKATQELRVDFDSFPLRFSDLIERCLAEQQKESPKFTLELRTSGIDLKASTDGVAGKAFLEVIELNDFKRICHLSLNLTQASLQNKLAHLSMCIKSLKNLLCVEQEKSKLEATSLSEEVRGLRDRLSAKAHEAEAMRQEMQAKMGIEMEKYSSMLSKEKENNLQMKSDCDRRLAREKRESESKFNEQLKNLKSENASLKKRCSGIDTKNENVEKDLREVQLKLQEVKEKFRLQTRDFNILNEEKADWKRDIQFKKETINKLKSQISHQGRDIQEKENSLQHCFNELAVLKQEKDSFQEKMGTLQTKLEKRETSIRHLFPEFQKGIYVIEKFQKSLNDEEKKNSALLLSVRTLEASLEERTTDLKMAEEEIELLKKKIPVLEAEIEDARNQIREANEKIGEKEKTLACNEDVISRLTKQLNELESLGNVIKRAPLVEAYLLPQNARTKIGASPPNPSVATSTPLNADSRQLNYAESSRPKFCSPNVPGFADIQEEISSQPTQDGKENFCELDPKYLEPSKKHASAYPVRGLLRANALPVKNKIEKGTIESKKQLTQVSTKPKKLLKKKPSAYFNVN